jgi:hypothetical protein
MVIEAPAPVPPVVARAPVPARVAPPAPPVASKPAVPSATIEDVRLRSYPTFTRVVVETSAVVKPRVEVVTPKELRIRLASVSTSRRAEEVRDGLLEAVHVEPAEGDSVLRVSFTGTSQEPKTSVLSDPPRLLFDFPRAGPVRARPAPGPAHARARRRARRTTPAPLCLPGSWERSCARRPAGCAPGGGHLPGIKIY